MKLKRIIIASATVALSVIFPVSANAVGDTSTYITAVPNIPAQLVAGGECPTGQTLNAGLCSTVGAPNGTSPVINPNTVPSRYTCNPTPSSLNSSLYTFSISLTEDAWYDGNNCFYMRNGRDESFANFGSVRNPTYSLVPANYCTQGTYVNNSCASLVAGSAPSATVSYYCPDGYVRTGVNCMSTSYSTINSAPIWTSVQDWFATSLLPKVVAWTVLAIGILLAISTVRRNGKKLI